MPYINAKGPLFSIRISNQFLNLLCWPLTILPTQWYRRLQKQDYGTASMSVHMILWRLVCMVKLSACWLKANPITEAQYSIMLLNYIQIFNLPSSHNKGNISLCKLAIPLTIDAIKHIVVIVIFVCSMACFLPVKPSFPLVLLLLVW